MAEAYLKALDSGLEVISAGTRPADEVHPLAVRVMGEAGIDLRNARPKVVTAYLREPFDYVLTVCDNAKEACPVFLGRVGRRLHIGFEDPADAQGTEEEMLRVFRRVRDEIRNRMSAFHREITQGNSPPPGA